MKLSNQEKANRMYSKFYGHLDDKFHRAAKTHEIADWLNDGQPITLQAAISEWRELDDSDIKIQANR